MKKYKKEKEAFEKMWNRYSEEWQTEFWINKNWQWIQKALTKAYKQGYSAACYRDRKQPPVSIVEAKLRVLKSKNMGGGIVKLPKEFKVKYKK